MADASQVSTSLRQYTPEDRSITRLYAPYVVPGSLTTEQWRHAVRGQEVAMIARDTLISYMLGVPWQITPKNPDVGDTYKDEIEYYTNLFNNTDGGYDVHLELVLQDLLDSPMGGTTELVRDPDTYDGTVVYYRHIDAATLRPTVIETFPIVQMGSYEPVYFPPYAISRIGWSPRTELNQRGWFMAPPEKVFLAIMMLVTGDRYYWSLLQDTPEMGILDLGDMSESSAIEWLNSWKSLLGGVDPFKIPVLYEHTQPINWIPFNRPPTDIIYDKITYYRASLSCAGYGITLADAGIPIENQSLAASIRQERRTDRTGFARIRTKVTRYWQTFLPSYLKFELIDRDDERLVAKGRARLANSMALRNLTDGGIVTREDAQQQLVADGLLTVPLSATSEGVNSEIVSPTHIVAKQLGKPVPASSGGEGDINLRSSARVGSFGLDPEEQSAWAELVTDVFTGAEVDLSEADLLKELQKGFADKPREDVYRGVLAALGTNTIQEEEND